MKYSRSELLAIRASPLCTNPTIKSHLSLAFSHLLKRHSNSHQKSHVQNAYRSQKPHFVNPPPKERKKMVEETQIGKLKSLLNKLSVERFNSISTQIVAALQVSTLYPEWPNINAWLFDKMLNEFHFITLYARLYSTICKRIPAYLPFLLQYFTDHIHLSISATPPKDCKTWKAIGKIIAEFKLVGLIALGDPLIDIVSQTLAASLVSRDGTPDNEKRVLELELACQFIITLGTANNALKYPDVKVNDLIVHMCSQLKGCTDWSLRCKCLIDKVFELRDNRWQNIRMAVEMPTNLQTVRNSAIVAVNHKIIGSKEDVESTIAMLLEETDKLATGGNVDSVMELVERELSRYLRCANISEIKIQFMRKLIDKTLEHKWESPYQKGVYRLLLRLLSKGFLLRGDLNSVLYEYYIITEDLKLDIPTISKFLNVFKILCISPPNSR